LEKNRNDMDTIRSHRDLEVWNKAMEAAMAIFEATKDFPSEERFSLTDQVRRSVHVEFLGDGNCVSSGAAQFQAPGDALLTARTVRAGG